MIRQELQGLGYIYYRKRCANRANFLDSFEGKLHSNFITSPLALRKGIIHITYSKTKIFVRSIYLLSQDYTGDIRFAPIL